jgi:hypothetical protein
MPQLLQLLQMAKKPNYKMAEQAVVAIKDLLVKGELFDKQKPLLPFTKNRRI